MLDLSSYSSIYQAIFVKLDIPNYEILRMSTHYKTVYVEESVGNSAEYTNLGQLLSVGDATSAIRATPEEITVTISGIPQFSIAIVVDQAIKGSKIEVRTLYFDALTWAQIGSPVIKFKGIVNNYNITEDYPQDQSQIATSTISLVCSTLLDLYENKQAGRRTNPLDQKSFYPNDLSMDRVPTITGSNFNFGSSR